jgi:hypothetical protein
MTDPSLRGKCRQASEAAVEADPSLRLARGYYHCPITGRREPHWWCATPDGRVVDPTAAQFASGGMGHYEEFFGVVSCEECGKSVPEVDAVIQGSHAVCSTQCFGRLVGVA